MSAQKTVFQWAVSHRLPVISDEVSRKDVWEKLGEMFENGYSVEDATAMAKCYEEVNPDLDEDTALARMAQIREKYKNKTGNSESKNPKIS